MMWVLGATLLVWLLALLPLAYGMLVLHTTGPEIRSSLIGYAPNQFLFLIVPFLGGAFSVFCALRVLIVRLHASDGIDPLMGWLTGNWPVVILFGVVVVSSITAVDYFFTAKVFDRLEPAYASKAVESAKDIRAELESHVRAEDREQRRAEVLEVATEEYRAHKKGPVLDRAQILQIPSATYLKLALDADIQRHWGLLNPTAHALSVLQLFVVLLTGFAALFAIVILWLAFKQGPANLDLTPAIDALAFALVWFALYPICYRYFVAEMEFVANFGSTIRGDILAALAILGAAVLLFAVSPPSGDWGGIAIRALPFFVVVGPGAYAALAGPLALRNLIGIDASFGTRIVLMIILFLFALAFALALWPRQHSVATNQSHDTTVNVS